jgi:hypothetical protein
MTATKSQPMASFCLRKLSKKSYLTSGFSLIFTLNSSNPKGLRLCKLMAAKRYERGMKDTTEVKRAKIDHQ